MTDGKTLETIINALSKQTSFSDRKPIVVIDAGIATEVNLKMLKSKQYGYMCVSRSNLKEYHADTNSTPVEIKDKRNHSDFCDYEGELVVVIGTGGKDIASDDAWDHVVGVTVGQDISDRVAQFAADPPHWDLGKSFDTFGPLGPVLVSVGVVANREAMRIRTSVNGEIRQDDTTANLMFDVPTLISYLSRITTLVAGDIIFTGTPDGIGAVSGRFLADGDVLTTTIDGIGTIENRCVRVSDHQDNDNQKEDH